jgi:hypothetical protein
MLNRRVLIENDRVVIFDTCVLLVGHFDLPIGKSVHLVILQVNFIHISLFIEKCCLNLSASHIDQFNIQQGAAAPLILPGLFLVFFCDTSFNFPVKQESVE